MAQTLARAALTGAIENVRGNVAALSEPALGRDLLQIVKGLSR